MRTLTFEFPQLTTYRSTNNIPSIQSRKEAENTFIIALPAILNSSD